jgi:hypothetical protein
MWGPLVVALFLGALREDPPAEPPATEPAPELEPAPAPEPAPQPAAVPDVIPEPAQPAPAPPPTNGIRIGATTLHPFFGAMGSYDTAVMVQPGGNAGDVVARARAGFDLKTDLEGTRIAANLTAGYDLFAGTSSPASRSLSFLSWGGLLDLSLNRTGRVHVDLKLLSRRSDDTDNTVAAAPLLSLYNLARVTVPIRASDKLTLKPLVELDYDAFSPLSPSSFGTFFGGIASDPSTLYEMSYLDFKAGLDAHWLLVPSTALVASASFGVRNYPFAQSMASGFANSSTNLPAELLKITAGATSALTRSLSAQLLIGVGADFGGSNARTAIGQATLGWQTERFGARLGYVRTMNPIPIFGVMTQDRLFAETLGLPREGLMLSLLATGDNVSYALTTRSDQLLSVRASIDWQIISVLAVGFSYRLNVRLSNVASAPLNFMRHEPMLTLTATWRDVPDRVPAWSEVPTRIEVPRALLSSPTM